jgi:ATP-binding cassette subfamily F protein uup
MAALLQLSNIALTFGGAPLLSGADLAVARGESVALVGRNGSGKSTLLRIAAGVVEADSGLRFADPAARIVYLAQEPQLGAFATAGDFARATAGAEAPAHAVERWLGALEVEPSQPANTLSGGEARRAALAGAFAGDPDVILLDEPTNHLDVAAIDWLERRLDEIRAGAVIISHDRKFLENVTRRTVWLDRGVTRQLDRGFGAFEEWRDRLLEEEEQAAHKLDRKIVAEEHWVRYGVTARRKRNVRRMRELDELRRSRQEALRAPGSVTFTAAAGATSGKRVIVAEDVSKSFGERAVVSHLSLVVGRGDRIGVVGPNGAGKTTLLNLLTKRMEPDRGEVVIGSNVEMIVLDQRRKTLDPDMRLADAIADGRGDWIEINGQRRHVATYLKDFLFAPEQFRSPVSVLSGGERARLALASALAKPSNLLVLDEPTNDLDLETLDLLEELIAGYQGAVLIVSHDRALLDRAATSILAPALDGSGRWIEYVGGYGDMVLQRGAPPFSQIRVDAADRAPRAAARPVGEAPRPRASASVKLSFKEKRALETLPQEIDALTSEIARLRADLEDAGLFQRDPDGFKAKAARLQAAEHARAVAEDEWLRLELKREAERS